MGEPRRYLVGVNFYGLTASARQAWLVMPAVSEPSIPLIVPRFHGSIVMTSWYSYSRKSIF